MENHRTGTEILVKTRNSWEDYLNKAPVLDNFLPVVQNFIDEINEMQVLDANLKKFYAELVHWLKLSVKTRSSEVSLLLKAYDLCLDKEIYSSDKFQETTKLLFNFLSSFDNQVKMPSHVYIDIFKTLLKSSESILFYSNFQEAEDLLEKIILNMISFVFNLNDDEMNSRFLHVFSEMITDGKGKPYFPYFIKKKSVINLTRLMKKMTNSIELRITFNILQIFINEFEGNYCELNLGKFLLKCSSFGDGFFYLKMIFKILFKRMKTPKDKNECIEIKMIILSIISKKKISEEILNYCLKKFHKRKWFDCNLSKDFKNNAKDKILSCQDLSEKIKLLDLIIPWLNEGFTVQQLKLMIKQCSLNIEILGTFLYSILVASRQPASYLNYYKISPDKVMKFDFDFNFSKTKEFSIWLSVMKKHLSDSDIVIDVLLNKGVIISVVFEAKSITVSLTKGKSKGVLLNSSFNLEEGSWNTVGISLNLLTKNSGRYRFGLNINNQVLETWDKEFSKFKEINSIRIAGKCRLAFVKLFPSASKTSNSNDCIFSLTPHKQPLCKFYLKCFIKSKLVRKVSVSDVIKHSGTLTSFLPLLRESKNLNCFLLFFKLLPEFSEVLSPDFFFVLQGILIENKEIINLKFLDSCEKFLESLSKAKIFYTAFEQLYLCTEIWSCLSNDLFVFYLEAVKTHLTGEHAVSFLNYWEKIVDFFYELSRSVKSPCDKLVVYYLFLISGINLKKIEIKRMESFLVVFKGVMYFGFEKVVDEFYNYLVDIGRLKWNIENDEKLYELINTLTSHFYPDLLKITSQIFKFCLKIMKKYFFSNQPSMSKERQNAVCQKTMALLEPMTKPVLYPDILLSLTTFLAKKKVFSSPLKSFSSLMIDSLVLTSQKNQQVLSKDLDILIKQLKTSKDFVCIIIKDSQFPAWTFSLFQLENLKDQLISLIKNIFSYLDLYSNFDMIRVVLFELVVQERYSEIFTFLSQFFISCFCERQSQINIRKYLLEFFNVVEDVIIRIQYDCLPIPEFYEFLDTCVLSLKDIRVSTNFPHLPGISSYALFEKPNIFKGEYIALRDGGLARQLIFLILTGMSISPKVEFEQFLFTFTKEKYNFEENRIEWTELDQEANLRRIGVITKNVKGNSKNLMHLYIFHEWALIIRKYQEAKFDSQDILNSVASLMYFAKLVKLEDKIISECRILQDSSTFRIFEKIREDNLMKMKTFYSLNSSFHTEVIKKQNEHSNLVNLYGADKSLENMKFYSAVIDLANSMESCKKTNDFYEVINKYLNNFQVQTFFIVLTSLKINRLTYLFLTKPPEYSFYYIKEHEFKPSVSTCDIKVKAKEINRELKFSFEYQLIHKEFIDHCAAFREPEGKFFIKNSFDRAGRRLLLKKKQEVQSPLDTSIDLQLNSSFDCLKNSFSLSKIDESEINNLESDDDFICEDFEVIFPMSQTKVFEFDCEMITTKGAISGQLNLFNDYLYFASNTQSNLNNPMIKNNESPVISSVSPPESQLSSKKIKIWKFSQVQEINFRKYIHIQCALEIFFVTGKNVFFNFFSQKLLQEVYAAFSNIYRDRSINFVKKRDALYYQELWRQNKISNFAYLMKLNRIAGRTFNDLNQYPIFPWVLSDYKSKNFKLDKEESFRKLKHPISSQSEDQQKISIQNYAQSKNELGFSYHYFNHYSTTQTLLFYTLRIEPFTTRFLKLHKWEFDIPDKIFGSISKVWDDLGRNRAATKELIPEMFYCPYLFLNINEEDLGVSLNGSKLDNVKLPKWAKGSVYLFLIQHQKALESSVVNRNLHFWVDLIFGYKQTKQPAIDSLNIYHPLTYNENYKKIMSENPSMNIKNQAAYCGQIPDQLFTVPHPVKTTTEKPFNIFERLINGVPYSIKKKYSDDFQIIPLFTVQYFILLKIQEKVYIKKFKWTNENLFDSNSYNESELVGVCTPEKLFAVVYRENLIVSSGYSNCSICIHKLDGSLIDTFYFHTNIPSFLIGGKWIISGSVDSTLVVWDNQEIQLFGHLNNVKTAAGIYEYSLVASCSDYILIHNTLTARVLYKIIEKCSKILSNNYGHFFAHIKNELKVLYLTGSELKVLKHGLFKKFCVEEEWLLLEDRQFFKVFNPFDDEREVEIHMQEALDIEQILYYGERDCLLFVSEGSSKTLCYLELSSRF